MDRFEKLDADLDFRTIGGERVATFSPSASAMVQVCLGLSLIWHRLIGRLIFECSGRRVLSVTLDDAIDAAVAAFGVWQPPTMKVRMSPTEMERWLAFALTYYRDGMGAVDHIDLDVWEDSGVPTVGLVFKVPNAVAPMSPEELRRALGKP